MSVQAESWFDRVRRGVVPGAPVTSLLRGEVLRLDLQAGVMEVEYQAGEAFTNPAGHVQGGMLTAMLDDAMGLLAQAPLAAGEFAPTLTLTVAFLRPAQVGRLKARAAFVRKGREVFNVSGELYQNERLIAHASAVAQVKGA